MPLGLFTPAIQLVNWRVSGCSVKRHQLQAMFTVMFPTKWSSVTMCPCRFNTDTTSIKQAPYWWDLLHSMAQARAHIAARCGGHVFVVKELINLVQPARISDRL